MSPSTNNHIKVADTQISFENLDKTHTSFEWIFTKLTAEIRENCWEFEERTDP